MCLTGGTGCFFFFRECTSQRPGAISASLYRPPSLLCAGAVFRAWYLRESAANPLCQSSRRVAALRNPAWRPFVGYGSNERRPLRARVCGFVAIVNGWIECELSSKFICGLCQASGEVRLSDSGSKRRAQGCSGCLGQAPPTATAPAYV